MLKISPVSFGNIYKPAPSANNTSFTSRLKKDEFVRTTNPITSSEVQNAEDSTFSNWVKESGIIEKLPEILRNPDNVIGTGYVHKVYRIPDCDEYVLRVLRNTKFDYNDFSVERYTDTEDRDLKINIGQSIGSIKLRNSNKMTVMVDVLKKQKGTSIGNPPPQAICNEYSGELREDEEPYEAMSRKIKYADSLKSLASLPVETYEELIQNVKEASKLGYKFDYLNSNNLLVDEENQQINLIDMDCARGSEEDYGSLLYALTNIKYFGTYCSKYDGNPVDSNKQYEAIKNTIQITEKYLKAMKRQNVKFNTEKPTIEFFEFVRSLPATFLCAESDPDEKLKILQQKVLND